MLKHQHKIFTSFALIIAFTLIGLPIFAYSMSSKQPLDKTQPAAVQPDQSAEQNTDNLPQKPKPQYCPLAKELTKEDLFWTVGNTWKSYSESFVKKISHFVGAQWIGIKVGKVICLYIGENNNDFPIALEQVKSKIITEPSGDYWSALINNHKICHSANVFDCPYYVQVAEDIKQVYKAIEYQPQTSQSTNNADF